MVAKYNGTYKSNDNVSTIGYVKWSESDKPKAIIQLVHGMAEYIERYEDFAVFLVGKGYVVYGNNHIGHGSSVASNDDLGHLPGKTGYRYVGEDVHTLKKIAKREYPNTPYILLGHSMGSLIARQDAATWGDELDALILSGTSGKNPLSGIGLLLIDIITMFKGPKYKSKLIYNMAFGSYNKRCSEKRTLYDWLSFNTDNVDKYVADDKSGFMFTVSGFRNLMALLKNVTSKSWYEEVPKTLPILLISGKEDPVGAYGAGVIETEQGLKKSGVKDVTMILYDHMRHEILKETDNMKVYEDILEFIDRETEKVKKNDTGTE